MDSVELENRLKQVVEAAGYHLLASHWKPMRGKPLLRIAADAEDHNITVNECAELSRAISDLLDSYPHDFPDYRLEVSSPGLNRPLETWQYRKNLGRLVEVYYTESGSPLNFRGVLSAFSEAGIEVRAKKESRRFATDAIEKILALPSL